MITAFCSVLQRILIVVGLVVGLWLGLAGSGWADKQVLLGFDLKGHSVLRVIDTPKSLSFRQDKASTAPKTRYLQPEIAINELESGTAGLIWLDSNGVQIHYSVESDPRITHSPGHIHGALETRTPVENGAWLVKGPQQATYLIVMLASDLSISLLQEIWELDLSVVKKR